VKAFYWGLTWGDPNGGSSVVPVIILLLMAGVFFYLRYLAKRNEREKDERAKRYLEKQKRQEAEKERLSYLHPPHESLDKRVSDYFATLPETHPIKRVGNGLLMTFLVIGFLVIVIIVVAVMLHNGSCQVDGDFSTCFP